MSGFCLQRQGRGWIVAGPNGRALTGVYGDRNLAAVRLGELQDLAETTERRMRRACMCCGREFLSAGIQNRLCAGCRTGTPVEHMPARSRHTAKAGGRT
ncbi:MAG: hypothetical protein CVT82_00475 [Alphaproteobacteria bacterium HGW-Alphaproteobacteria-4]|nr:MAG: hypothetical protein CVT82_00475 [Alphaproteobacteria bacterium HGW-Alphaproteobacteria-4]